MTFSLTKLSFKQQEFLFESHCYWYGFAVGLVATILAVLVHGFFEVTPAGIPYERIDTYYYIVSPILWVLAGSLVRTQRILNANYQERLTATPIYSE